MNKPNHMQSAGKGRYSSRQENQLVGGLKPPQAIELENAVLGAILTEGQQTYDRVFDILHEHACFYSPRNVILWEVMHSTSRKGLPVDLLTVSNQCMSSAHTAEMWTPYELTKLSADVVSSASIESHCRIILEKHMARRTIDICGQVTKAAYSDDDIFTTLEYAEGAIFDLSMGRTGSEMKAASSIADENMRRIIARVNNPTVVSGIPSGFPSLDMLTGGWQNEDLIILGGKPGLGKTALALNFLLAAAKSSCGVGLFSLEMGETQIMNRLYAIESQIPLEFIRSADLTKSQLEQVGEASARIKGLSIHIDTEAAISVYDLRSKARKTKTKHDIGLVIVDYLQLMRGEAHTKGNREQEVASISRGLKAIAKELKVPILALSQLNKSGEVRESTAIENDASVLMVLDRADYKKMDHEIDPTMANTAQLRIEKNRDGALGDIALDTHLATQRLFEPLKDYPAPNPAASFRPVKLPYHEEDGPPF